MKQEVLEKNHNYHLYSRVINSCNLFENEENMAYFLKLASKHLKEKIELIAYCLMKNHFHFAVRITANEKLASQGLSNLFNAYSKAYNKQQKRGEQK